MNDAELLEKWMTLPPRDRVWANLYYRLRMSGGMRERDVAALGFQLGGHAPVLVKALIRAAHRIHLLSLASGS